MKKEGICCYFFEDEEDVDKEGEEKG